MKKLCRRTSTLLLGACFAAPLAGWADPAFPDHKGSKPDIFQEQKQPTLKDKRVRENTPPPSMQAAPPSADMPIIIQDRPLNTGIVKSI